jgi:hypothetical protein
LRFQERIAQTPLQSFVPGLNGDEVADSLRRNHRMFLKWSHHFGVNASVDAIYEKGFSPQHWFSFFKQYRGLQSIDGNWPEEGSSVVVRFALGPWTVAVRNTIVEHERGKRLHLREEALAGLWIDRVEFILQPRESGMDITLTTHPTTQRWWAWPGVLLVWLWGARETPRAMQRFKSLVENAHR